MARVLIVEDQESIREAVAALLREDGHEVETRGDGSDVADWVGRFDLFLLDVGLPGRDGFSLARELREKTAAPFLFLTAQASDRDRLAGWELGADDYVVKPFLPRELVLRVRSILKRTVPRSGGQWFALEGSRLEVDASSHRLVLDGKDITLTAGEWSFLETLTQNAGTVLSRRELMSGALLYYVDTGARTVDTHIKNLRAKLGDRNWIETVRGFGYRFAGAPQPSP